MAENANNLDAQSELTDEELAEVSGGEIPSTILGYIDLVPSVFVKEEIRQTIADGNEIGALNRLVNWLDANHFKSEASATRLFILRIRNKHGSGR